MTPPDHTPVDVRPEAAPPASPTAGASVRRHGIWAVIGRVLNSAALILVTVILARVLTPPDFQRFNVLRTVLALSGLAAASGLGTAALQLLGEARGGGQTTRLRRIVRQTSHLGVVTSVGVCGLAMLAVFEFGPQLFGASAGWQVVILVAIATLGTAGLQVCSELIRGLGNPAWANLLGGLRGAPLLNLSLVAGVFVVWSAWGVDWVSAGWVYAGLSVVIFAYAVGMVARHLPPRGPAEKAAPGGGVREPLWGTAWPLGLASLLGYAAVQCDMLLAPALMDEAEATNYVAARRVALMLMFPLSILNTASAGFIGTLYYAGDRRRLERLLRAGATALSVPCLAVAAVAAAWPEVVARLALGEGYAGASAPLRWLLPGQLAVMVTGACGLLLNLTGHGRTTLAINVVGLAVLLVIGPAACRYGAEALAAFVAVLIIGLSIAPWLMAWWKTGINTFAAPRLLLDPVGLIHPLRRPASEKPT